MKAARRNKSDEGPDALSLIEESVHLLRRVPPSALAIYYAGTVPFVLSLLYFWAHTTWFAPPPEELMLAACGLTLAFALMKTAHSEFCARLMACRLGVPPPDFSARRLVHVGATQMRLQAWGFLVLPVAIITALPFGWAFAYFQSLSVANEDATHAEAMRQAQLWPGPNHLGIALFVLIAAAAMLNISATLSAIPSLAESFLGIENLFGFSSQWFGNTTFLASVAALGWLVVDPLVKAFYTLRVFHGRARTTGEDLRIAFQALRRPARGARVLAAALVLLVSLPSSGSLRAAEAAAGPAAPAAASPAQIDAAIKEVLSGRDFQWQLRPIPKPVDESSGGPIMRFIRAAAKILSDIKDSVLRWLGKAVRWLLDWLFPDGPPSADSGAVTLRALRALLYVLIAAAVVILAVVLWRRRKDRRRSVSAVVVSATTVPDLDDERTRADQLSTEGWLGLAREQLARGEWRLALRALYLATLARFAADGLLSLAKSKTNLDYEREVRRRAAGREDVAVRFSSHRATFETVWYGRTQADEVVARRWLSELEGASPS